jgi:hypothetical protein
MMRRFILTAAVLLLASLPGQTAAAASAAAEAAPPLGPPGVTPSVVGGAEAPIGRCAWEPLACAGPLDAGLTRPSALGRPARPASRAARVSRVHGSPRGYASNTYCSTH